MRPHLPAPLPVRRPFLVGVAVTAAAMFTAAAGITATAAVAGQSATAADRAASADSAPLINSVLLINGDRVQVTSAHGAPHIAMVAPAASGTQARSMLIWGVGGRTYVIPAAVLPYVGSSLNLSLFDLPALQRLEKDGRLPLRISFRGHLPELPGVRITRFGASTAQGYLTAASARLFGAALDRQLIADHVRGSYGGGIFARVRSISLAGSAAPTAMPDYPMRTLTVRGTDLNGTPDNGDSVLITSVDNSNRFGGIGAFYHGLAKLSVPTGHYWAVGDFFDFGQAQPSERLVILPQFTVAKNTTVQIREQAASSEITMVTPRPAAPENTSIEIRRPGRSGPPNYDEFLDSGISLWVSPTSARPTVGKLQAITAQQLISPRGAAGAPYEYNLAYRAAAGIIPRQRYVIRSAGLATINAFYYQDLRTAGAELRFGLFPIQFSDLLLESFNPFRLPRHQTEYMTGNPSILWTDELAQLYPVFLPNGRTITSLGGHDDALRVFRAGERLRENWNAYPLHPAPNVNLIGRANLIGTLPSASRAGNTLILNISPFGGSQPGHTGPGFSSRRYRVDQKGGRIAGRFLGGEPGVLPGGQPGFLPLPGFNARLRLSPRSSLIRLVLNASRTGKSYPLSPRIRAVWTWRSSRQPRAMLPKGWVCRPATTIPLPTAADRHCAAQPMMTLRYAVAGLELNGLTRPGRQMIGIEAGHLQLARAAATTGAKVLVSFDDGRTWRAARLIRTGDRFFRATFTAPAGAYVTLRTSATDAAGGSVTETIVRGYKTAS